jgi:kynurenine formamidase
VEFTSVAEIQDDGYYLRGFALGEHSATHINPHSAGKIRKKVF